MKCIHVYALFLMVVFHTSCGQNQTNSPQDNIKSSRGNYSESQFKEADTSRVPTGMVRNVKLARNGDILIASWLAVFRYDGTSFTNLTGKIISPRFASFWDVLEDRKGDIGFATNDSGVYYYNGKSFQHFTTRVGLADNQVIRVYEDKAGIIGFGIAAGVSRYYGKSFRNYIVDGNGMNEDRAGNLHIQKNVANN